MGAQAGSCCVPVSSAKPRVGVWDDAIAPMMLAMVDSWYAAMSIVNNFGVPSRYDNDISYKSPRIAGVPFSAHYALKETATEAAGQRGVSQLALDYSNGPWRAG